MAVDSLNLNTTALHVSAQENNEVDILNGGPGTLYYKTTADVSSTSYDGTIADGAKRRFRSPQWIVTTTNSKVFLDHIEHDRDQINVHGIPDTAALVGSEVINVQSPDYGALGDGVQDDTAEIQAAIDACPDGGTVLLPPGDYLISGTLEMKNKPINLVGAGGLSQQYSTTPFIRESATRITSSTNLPMLHIYEANYTSIESCGSTVSDIAFEGTPAAGSSQKGIWIDNRAIRSTFRNVVVAATGSNGWVLSDCVTATFINCHGSYCNVDGWLLDTSLGTDSSNAAVTNSTFVSCTGTGNTGNGWTLRGGAVWGNVWLGGDAENNGAYGIQLKDLGTGTQVRFNRMVGMWSEGNTTASVRIDSGPADNDLDFVRVESAPSLANANAGLQNSIHYSNLAGTSRGQRKSFQLPVIRAGGLSSSDTEAVSIRTRGDDNDGYLRAKGFLSTYGLTMDADDVLPTTVPTGDAICLPNNRGITARNAADDASKQLFLFSGSDILTLGATGIVTKILAELNVIGAFNHDGTTFGALGATPTTQQATVADASTSHDLNATFSDTEVEAALNALATKINSILATLEAFGFHATA